MRVRVNEGWFVYIACSQVRNGATQSTLVYSPLYERCYDRGEIHRAWYEFEHFPVVYVWLLCRVRSRESYIA